jgi:hypothetical protein
VAVGQGTGGTLGESAVGSATFTIVIPFGQKGTNGMNPAKGNGKTRRPRVSDMTAGWAHIVTGDNQRVGRGFQAQFVAFEGARKKYKGGSTGIETIALDFSPKGSPGTQAVYLSCIAEDSPTNNHCAITGGTGRYAGARGTALQDFNAGKEDKKAKTFSFPLTLTFVP